MPPHKFKVGDIIESANYVFQARVLATFTAPSSSALDLVYERIDAGYPRVYLGTQEQWTKVMPRFQVGKTYRRIVDNFTDHGPLKVVGVKGDWAVGFYQDGHPCTLNHDSLVQGRFEEVLLGGDC